jgi:Carbohydrate family 9 binding domain-like
MRQLQWSQHDRTTFRSESLMRMWMTVTASLIIVLFLTACTGPQLTARCHRATGTITIDGLPNEKAWESAHWVNLAHFVSPAHDKLEPGQTALLWDDSYLYMAGKLMDADVITKVSKRDGPVWREDCVEFFIDAVDHGRFHYELCVTPDSVLYDSCVYFEQGYKWRYTSEKAWNPRTVEVKSKRVKNGWAFEMRIRLDEMPTAYHIPPKHGDEWGLNMYRMNFHRGRKPDAIAWSPSSSFHDTAQFGRLVFAFPKRVADAQVRSARAEKFFKEKTAYMKTSLTDDITSLKVVGSKGLKFAFDEETRTWKAAKGDAYVEYSEEPELTGEIEVRNRKEPVVVTCNIPKAGKAVVIARIFPRTINKRIPIGRSDGTILTIATVDGKTDTARMDIAPWQLLEVTVAKPGPLTLTFDPGPLGECNLDKTQVSVYLVGK